MKRSLLLILLLLSFVCYGFMPMVGQNVGNLFTVLFTEGTTTPIFGGSPTFTYSGTTRSELGYSSGTVDIIGANTARVQTAGLLLEGAHANLLPYKDFDDNWAVSSATNSANITRGGTTYYNIYTNTGDSAATTNSLDADSIRSSTNSESVKIIITNAGDSDGDVQFSNNITNMPIYCTNGTEYTLSFWVKASESVASIVVKFQEGDDDQTNYGLNDTFTATTSWTRITKTFTCNTTASDGQINLKFGNLGTYTIQLDAFSFEQSSFANSWVGGDVAVGADLVTDGVFEAHSAANAYTSDFSSDANGWTAGAGAADGDIDGIGLQDDNLRYTIDATNGYHYLNRSASFTVGKTYRLRFDYYLLGANDVVDGIKPWAGAFEIATETATDTWTNVDTYFTAQNTALRIYAFDGVATEFQDAGGDDVFYIRNVIVDAVTLASWTDTADGLAPGTDGAGALTNKASWSGDQTGNSDMTQASVCDGDLSAPYRVSFTVTRSAGTMQVWLGASGYSYSESETPVISASGTYYYYLTPAKDGANRGMLYIKGDADFIGTVDSVEVKLHGTAVATEAGDASDNGLKYSLSSALQASLADEGTMIVEWTPGFAWDDIPDNTYALGVVACLDNGSSLLFLDRYGGSGKFGSNDGTTNARSVKSWASGTTYRIAVRWGYEDSGTKFQVGVKDGTWSWGTAASFDGSFTIGGDSELKLGYGNEISTGNRVCSLS